LYFIQQSHEPKNLHEQQQQYFFSGAVQRLKDQELCYDNQSSSLLLFALLRNVEKERRYFLCPKLFWEYHARCTQRGVQGRVRAQEHVIWYHRVRTKD
jgi:hypothetical protein